MSRIAVPPQDAASSAHAYAARHHAPEIMAAADALSAAVYRHSQLSLREFEGARVRIAQINGCLICQRFRAERDAAPLFGGAVPLVSDHGPAPDEAFYAAVEDWSASPLFSPRERTAIEFGERFALEPKLLAADEAFWTRAKALFGDAGLVDLAYCAAAWMGMGRVAHVLGFDTVCEIE